MARRRLPQELTVTIERLDDDGCGLSAVDERRIRTKNALADEVAEVRVLRRRKGEWLAEAQQIENPSVDRREPACRYFPRCGGCAMQHLAYDAQLALKERGLLDALSAVGVEPLRVLPPTRGPRYHYRTKARFGVRQVGGRILVGFRESFSNRVGRMDHCLTLTESLAELLAPLKALIEGLSAPDRIPQVEVAAGDRDQALLFRHLDPLTAEDESAISRFATRHGVRCFSQSGGYDTVRPIDAMAAASDTLSYANPDFGLNFRFKAMDFTQVNLAMNRKLVRAAVLNLQAVPGAQVLDLFCGIGNFSLALAAQGYRVRGLEAAPDAIERAWLNARLNRLEERCEFAVQDLYHPDCLHLGRADYLLLDPPRSGAGPNLGAWLDGSGARRVVYVSCSPASFASDALVLKQAGFVLEQVGIYDMFPHTAHVETLGVFQKSW